MSTLKGIALGFMEGGVPGAVEGGIDPQAPVRQAQYQGAMAQAKLQQAQGQAMFATAQAAHEVTQAHSADLEYQALPQKLQDEQQGRQLDNLGKAKQAGYMPIASIALDQGEQQNTRNAMTALKSVAAQYGTVPQGLLYIHVGDSMQVLKLQDSNAALPVINQSRMAIGSAPIDPATFASLSQQDKDGMARNAINFTSPRDVNGLISQQSLDEANMRLATVKAQPSFNGQDQLVSSLTAEVQHQTDVLNTGASASAIRAGKAAGAQAQAAQPGTTAAKISEINATSGPEAAAAQAKARGEALGTAEGQAAGGGGPQQDILGGTFTPPPGGPKETNKVRDSFKKDADDLAKTEGTFNQFQSVLNDINSGKDITGAQSVVALFNAIGISATPLKGMGMRINSNTVQEHVQARGLGQSLYQKFLGLKSGDLITPQQIKDYATIAVGARHDAYVNKINEARSAGVDPSFLLPRGNGRPLDKNTGSIFYDTAAGNTPQQKAANGLKAAQAVGWQ
ncbi:MAG TPA: hypothetical protein VN087_02625 [Verrucomicrobiae bacterium]|nr:hypothetical protein [Verrucomicrobiae bacterium]